MDLRLTFNEVPELYDRLRPTYVPELYSDIFNYSGIGKGSRALEIGIGTGQATKPFLDAGVYVTAIEFGSELAVFTAEKYSEYDNLYIINSAFEDYECFNSKFDLIYSATAFHWIPEKEGYEKVFRLLKSGGTFARFRNYPYRDKSNISLSNEIDELYKKNMSAKGGKKLKEFSLEDATVISDKSKKYGFIEQECKIYKRIRTMDAENYINLIKTYSDHISMGEDKLGLFSNEMRKIIINHGGIINIYDTQDLQLARKP